MRRTRKRQQEKKKELKEDLFVTSVTMVWQKASPYLKYIIGAAAVVVLAVVIVRAARQRSASVSEKGWTELALLEKKVGEMESSTEEEREAQEDARLAGLGKVVQKASGGEAEAVALYYYAQALFTKGGDENISKAEEACRQFLQRYPDNYFAVAVKQLMAKTLFEQEKYAEALDLFDGIYNSFLAGAGGKIESIKYEARYYWARCRELLGERDAALEAYRQLADEKDTAPVWADMAAYRLSKLNS